MRVFLLFPLLAFTISAAPRARSSSTIPSGVPLRVVLEKRVPIRRVGEPIQGRLVEPVYVFDRIALPAGAVVEGHIVQISRVPVARRLRFLLYGNFTPPRAVRAQFDTLVLSDGSRLPIRTALSSGTAHTVRVGMRSKLSGRTAGNRAAMLAFTPPGKMSQLKTRLFKMLPYHRQAWSPGTLFTGALREPLTVAETEAAPTPAPGAPQSGALEARLLKPLSSAMTRKGAPVEAVVTQPLFSSDGKLLVPEGSRVFGEVVEARPARHLRRDGRLLFAFRRIQVPAGRVFDIHGYLQGLEANFDDHIALDQEGAAEVRSPKTRFIFPAIATAVAGLSLHQDYNAEGVPDQDVGGRAESGAVGLGLVGTVVAQASRELASTIAFTGAAFAVYSALIARGNDVVLPANTQLEISLGARPGEPAVARPIVP
jgi:hypothetical protein